MLFERRPSAAYLLYRSVQHGAASRTLTQAHAATQEKPRTTALYASILLHDGSQKKKTFSRGGTAGNSSSYESSALLAGWSEAEGEDVDCPSGHSLLGTKSQPCKIRPTVNQPRGEARAHFDDFPAHHGTLLLTSAWTAFFSLSLRSLGGLPTEAGLVAAGCLLSDFKAFTCSSSSSAYFSHFSTWANAAFCNNDNHSNGGQASCLNDKTSGTVHKTSAAKQKLRPQNRDKVVSWHQGRTE